MRTFAAELVHDAHAQLGESPVWDGRDSRLVWIDGFARTLHRFDPATRGDDPLPYELEVGAVAPRAAGGFVAAVGTGFGFLDAETGWIETLGELEDPALTTMNDGKCDPAGRFWAGTYDRDEEAGRPIAALYRLDPSGAAVRMLEGVRLSNGLGWSPDGATMYYVDSLTRRIDAFDFDAASGAISGRRALASFDEPVLPDGLSVDVDGHVWVAVWEGSRVERIAPDGSRSAVVELPTTHVTSCAFGGPDLTDLYITSAACMLTDEARSADPHAGGLFCASVGVRGLPAVAFAG